MRGEILCYLKERSWKRGHKKKQPPSIPENIEAVYPYSEKIYCALCGSRLVRHVDTKSHKETTVLGTSTVDGDDMIHGFGATEKAPFGLKKRFTSFMDNMTGSGFYLTEPKSVKKYAKTLAD